MELSKLFRWKKKVDIKDGNKVLDTVYIRLVGDIEYQEARTLALKASRVLRSKMRDTNSDEYTSNFIDLEALTKDELINSIVINEIPDFRDEVIIGVKEEPEPELPDNPSLEQQEEYEKKLEEIKANRFKAISEGLTKKGDERKTELEKLPIEDLRKQYVTTSTNGKSIDEFNRVFREYQVYKGTYKDQEFKYPAFGSFSDFTNSSPILKNQLISAYTTLEVMGEDLKN